MNKKFFLILFVLILLILIVFFSAGYNNDNTTWSVDKREYPQDEYTIDELPVSHKSAIEVRQFFDDSDSDHDGVLKGEEISDFDYKIKHSQFTFNGPYGYN